MPLLKIFLLRFATGNSVLYQYEHLLFLWRDKRSRKWWWTRRVMMTEENSRQAVMKWVNRRKRGGVVCSLLILILLMAPFQWPQKGHSHPFNKLVTMGATEQGRARGRRQKIVERKKIKPLGLFSSSNGVCVDSRPGTAWLRIWLFYCQFWCKTTTKKQAGTDSFKVSFRESLMKIVTRLKQQWQHKNWQVMLKRVAS